MMETATEEGTPMCPQNHCFGNVIINICRKRPNISKEQIQIINIAVF